MGVSREISALGERFGVPLRGIEAILELQAADPTASTTVRDPASAVDRHVADSLVALELDDVRRARRLAYIGSATTWRGRALAAARS